MLMLSRLSRPALWTLLWGCLLVLSAPAALAAPIKNDPEAITSQTCSFSSTWFDNLSRALFGFSLILLIIATLAALRNMQTEGPWGGIIAIAGIGLLFGMIGLLPNFAGAAIAAAAGPACP